MGEVERELQLAAEMAAISVVAVPELVEASKDSSAMGRLQDKLDDSKDRVEAVKKILTDIEAHEVTPELAESLDSMLERSIEDIGLNNEVTDELEAVGGVESLGLTLSPSDYIRTRLAGCESFLSEVTKIGKALSGRISKAVKESYITLTASAESLEKSLDALEKALNEAGAFKKGQEEINLGLQMFNLFKVKGKLSQNWGDDVEKVVRTITGLSNNYFLNERNSLNTLVSYVGGFEGKNDEQFKEKVLMLHKALPSRPFKECTVVNRDLSDDTVVVKQSVEIMGGAYFIDSRLKNLNLSPKTVEDSLGTLSIRLDKEKTTFYKDPTIIYPDDDSVDSLSSDEIKNIIKKCRVIIQSWTKSIDGGPVYLMEDREYLDLLKAMENNDLSAANRDILLNIFTSYVRTNQLGVLAVKSKAGAYIALMISGLVKLASLSIKANT